MSITKEQVLNALSHVDEPDQNKDLVTLNMIEDVRIEGKEVAFSVVLSSQASPSKDMIYNACVGAIHHFIDKDIDVNVHMTSRVSSINDNIKNILPAVKNVVAISSGKGGVGKSTTTVNLAFALAREGARVGIIDADIYGPSIPTMVGLADQRPGVDEVNGKQYIVPLEKHGIKVMSIGFMVREDQPVVWRGPMVSKALNQFFSDVYWGELDYLLIDLPPGTGDIQLSLATSAPITATVVVTTPQEVALIDVKKAISMFQLEQIQIPILGIIENMSWFTPEELPNNKYFIFGENGGKKLAEKLDLPLLGEIPLVQGIREGGDYGSPIVLEDGHPAAEAYKSMANKFLEQVAILNAKEVHAAEL
jgi:ATP-binding protein involved in chromosome partitioning